MKKCSYCGAEYPDNATMCVLDQTPFEDIQSNKEIPPQVGASIKFPNFGIFSEEKIPVSLAIVSYLFFFPGAFFLAFCPSMAFIFTFVGMASHNGIVLPCLISGAVGILILLCLCIFPFMMVFTYVAFALVVLAYSGRIIGANGSILIGLIGGAFALASIYLSRGLRSGSRGWRTCALVLIWWWFVVMTFDIGKYLLIHRIPDHATTMEFFIGYPIAFLVQIWQYRVLTRPDIKDIFGV
jgi:hypothetical protein